MPSRKLKKPAFEWQPLWQVQPVKSAPRPPTAPSPQTNWHGIPPAPYPTTVVPHGVPYPPPFTPTGRRGSHHALLPSVSGHSVDPYRVAQKHNHHTPGNTPRKASFASRRTEPSAEEGSSVLPRASLSGLRLEVPLPHDLDPACYIPITVDGFPGLRLVSCNSVNKQMPNEAVMYTVDGAAQCIDDLVRGRRFIVHRAYFANQRGAETAVAAKPPVEVGLTVAHLLTLLVRRQYDGWIKTVGKMTGAAQVEDVVGRGEGPFPGVEVRYEDLYVVAIRRSTGKDGRVRWFPQIEVRFE